MKYNEIEAESRRRFIQNQKESMLLKILESLKARKSDDRTARGQKSLRQCVFESELLRLGKIVWINLAKLNIIKKGNSCDRYLQWFLMH